MYFSLDTKEKSLDILKGRKKNLANAKYQEEFNAIIRKNNLTIDQYISKYSLVSDESKQILGEYTMSLKGQYGDFITYLQYVDKLHLLETIHSLNMSRVSDYIKISLDVDVLYEKEK